MGISIMVRRKALWADQCKSLQPILVPHPSLTAHGVFTKRHDMSKRTGTKSVRRRQSITAPCLWSTECAYEQHACLVTGTLCNRVHAPEIVKACRVTLQLAFSFICDELSQTYHSDTVLHLLTTRDMTWLSARF